jgi:hypothetical protein
MSEEKVEQEVQPIKYWVCCDGVEPTLISEFMVQKLVDSKGDINIMDEAQTTGWQKASDVGIYPSDEALVRQARNAPAAPKVKVPDNAILVDLSTICSEDESLEVVMAMSEKEQVTLLMVGGRQEDVPAHNSLAYRQVKFHGARVVRDTVKRGAR